MEKVKCYHYTNPRAYDSMKTGSMYGDKGLLPIKRFDPFSYRHGLPDKANEGAVFCLLEPKPESWVNNKEFPNLCRYLIHDFFLRGDVILLSFVADPEDDAHVVERAHLERELYKSDEDSTKSSLHRAWQKYWNSRIPLEEYEGNYSVPEVCIFNTIEFERLNMEWLKNKEDAWKYFFGEC